MATHLTIRCILICLCYTPPLKAVRGADTPTTSSYHSLYMPAMTCTLICPINIDWYGAGAVLVALLHTVSVYYRY